MSSSHIIIDILRRDPKKGPKGYDEDDLPHMRKVVSYNNQHLAQE